MFAGGTIWILTHGKNRITPQNGLGGERGDFGAPSGSGSSKHRPIKIGLGGILGLTVNGRELLTCLLLAEQMKGTTDCRGTSSCYLRRKAWNSARVGSVLPFTSAEGKMGAIPPVRPDIGDPSPVLTGLKQEPPLCLLAFFLCLLPNTSCLAP